MTNRMIRLQVSVAVGIALAATLAACTSSPPEGASPSSRFPGPWAQDLEQMSAMFGGDFADRVFADGVVTEQELLEGKRLLEDCYVAAGLTAVWDEYGRVAVDGADASADQPPDAMGRCAFADGGVLVMYYQMLMNPEREDDWVIRARCLVEHGLVKPGFTGQELQRLFDAEESMPWSTEPDAQRCLNDPLGVVSTDG